jgi:hypothetical protein
MAKDAAISTVRKSLVRILTSRSLEKIVEGMDDKEFVEFFLKAAEYCIPKLQRTEIKADITSTTVEVFQIGDMEIPFSIPEKN